MNHRSDVNLKQDFAPPTSEMWKEAAEKLLKGAPFDKIMRTKTYEDIVLKPIYTAQDVRELKQTHTLPGQVPFVRATNAGGYLTHPWKTAQQISEPDPKNFNQALREGLQNGQDTITLYLNGENGLRINNLNDLDGALDQVDLQKFPLTVDPGENGLYVLSLISALCKKRKIDLGQIHGVILNDPLKELVLKGRLSRTLKTAFDHQAMCVKWTAENMAGMSAIAVDVSVYQNAGASAAQELAWALATGVEYIRQTTERGISINTCAAGLQFTFGLGANFFMEIAKLRAARMLWSQIVEAFGGSEKSQKMKIHARTGLLNKTYYDPYVNMLRTSTEAFSAIMGGVDSLHVGPFDEAIQTSDNFSRRIARNTHTILREECHLNRVIDPAGGSWYIEHLTNEIAEKSWTLFQQIEANGGMIKALSTGRIQEQAETVLKAREKNSASRKDRIVGTNMYPNLQEKPLVKRKNDAYIPAPKSFAANDKQMNELTETLKKSPDKIIEVIARQAESYTIDELRRANEPENNNLPQIRKLTIRRISEQFEFLRKAVESYRQKTGQTPKIFLSNMGTIDRYKARADFSEGFFKTAGLEIEYPAGFSSAKEAAAAAVQSGAPITALCSTDDAYPDIVPEFMKEIKKQKPEMICMLAGYPKNYVESFKEAGIDDFIHVRANVYNILTGLLRRLEVIQ